MNKEQEYGINCLLWMILLFVSSSTWFKAICIIFVVAYAIGSILEQHNSWRRIK